MACVWTDLSPTTPVVKSVLGCVSQQTAQAMSSGVAKRFRGYSCIGGGGGVWAVLRSRGDRQKGERFNTQCV